MCIRDRDTYNKDITIILDHIPEGCDYEMVLYDEEGNQVGIGKENGNGGLSTVSYTHLDVYKRQEQKRGSSRHWAVKCKSSCG